MKIEIFLSAINKYLATINPKYSRLNWHEEVIGRCKISHKMIPANLESDKIFSFSEAEELADGIREKFQLAKRDVRPLGLVNDDCSVSIFRPLTLVENMNLIRCIRSLIPLRLVTIQDFYPKIDREMAINQLQGKQDGEIILRIGLNKNFVYSEIINGKITHYDTGKGYVENQGLLCKLILEEIIREINKERGIYLPPSLTYVTLGFIVKNKLEDQDLLVPEMQDLVTAFEKTINEFK